MFDIEFYRDESGSSPVEDYIKSLPDKLRAKTYRSIMLLKEEGYDARRPLSSYLRNGIFELRSQIGTNLTRILYFYTRDKTIVFTNGFTKKTEVVPESEIALAERRKERYERIHQDG